MPTILIADDDPGIRAYLVELLGASSHRLLEAADGAAALQLVRAERPDLVITDVLMPVMDGIDFVRRLRDDPVIAHTPVLFASGVFHKQEMAAVARACGVLDVLTKPFDREALLRAVAGGLRNGPAVPAPVLAPNCGDEHLRLLSGKVAGKIAELEDANRRLTELVEESKGHVARKQTVNPLLACRSRFSTPTDLFSAQLLRHIVWYASS